MLWHIRQRPRNEVWVRPGLLLPLAWVASLFGWQALKLNMWLEAKMLLHLFQFSQLIFRATVVQEFNTLWNNIQSATIEDTSGNTAVRFFISMICFIFFAVEPRFLFLKIQATTIPTTSTTTTAAPNADITIDESLCTTEQSCFRTPAGCVGDACIAIATWRPTEDGMGVFFQMSTSDTWMAIGLSSDDRMVCPCRWQIT